MSSIEKRNEELAAKFLSLDLDIYEVAAMADVTMTLLEQYEKEKISIQKFTAWSGEQVLTHLEAYTHRVSFAVHHLFEMAGALKRKYEEGA